MSERSDTVALATIKRVDNERQTVMSQLSPLDAANQLAVYADERHVLPLLQAEPRGVVGRSTEIDACRVLTSRSRLAYRAGSLGASTITVQYAVDTAGDTSPTLLVLRARADGTSVEQPPDPDPHPGRVRLANGVGGWRFPWDPTVPALRSVFRSMGALDGQVVKYSPSKCCVMRFHDVARGDQWTYTKTAEPKVAERNYRRWSELQRVAAESGLALRIAQPLAYEHATGTIVQRGLPGCSVREALDSVPVHLLGSSIATGLATVHDSGIDCPPGVDVGVRQHETLRKLSRLLVMLPEAHGQLARIGEDLMLVKPEGAGRLVTSYGDFHAGQMTVADGQAWFCDFDSFVIDEAERDLGEFMAAAHVDGMGDVTLAASLSRALVEAYARRRPIDPRRLQWHAAVEFVTHVMHTVRGLRPGWRSAAERALGSYPLLRTLTG